MTTNWLKALYLNKDLSDEEYKDIPNYRMELHCHVMYKCFEVINTSRNTQSIRKDISLFFCT